MRIHFDGSNVWAGFILGVLYERWDAMTTLVAVTLIVLAIISFIRFPCLEYTIKLWPRTDAK